MKPRTIGTFFVQQLIDRCTQVEQSLTNHFDQKARGKTLGQPERHHPEPDSARPRGKARSSPERRRPVRFRARGGRIPSPRRSGRSLPDCPGRHRRYFRSRLRGNSSDAPGSQFGRHLSHRPRNRRRGPRRHRLEIRLSRFSHPRHLHGDEAPAHHRR